MVVAKSVVVIMGGALVAMPLYHLVRRINESFNKNLYSDIYTL